MGANGDCDPRSTLSSASGRVSAIAFGAVKTTVYLGSASGGVWKSTDAGKTWRNLTDQVAVTGKTASILGTGAIAVVPEADTTQDRVYVATGEGNGEFGYFAGDAASGGVLKSTDGGSTWEQLGLSTFSGTGIPGMAIVPGASGSTDTLYVATKFATFGSSALAAFSPSATTGLYKSTDGGDSWSLLSGTGDLPDPGKASNKYNGSATDVIVDPADSSNIYAAIRCDQCASGGIWRSTDSGGTWSQTNNFNEEGATRIAMAAAIDADATGGSVVLAARTADQWDTAYISTDGALTWTQAGDLPPGMEGCLSKDQAPYNMAVAIDPDQPKTFYLGLTPIFKSTDSGQTWIFTGRSTHVDYHVIKVMGGWVYAGNDGGITLSTDGGVTWNNDLNNGLNTIQFYGAALGPHGTAKAIAGAQDNGIIVMQKAPKWAEAYDADGGMVAISPTHPNAVFAETQGIGLLRSNRSGVPGSFTEISPPVSPDERPKGYIPFSLDPKKDERLIYGTSRVWESCRFAKQRLACNAVSGKPPSWTAISDDFEVGITDLRIAPSDPAVLYLVTDGGADGPFAYISTNSNTTTAKFTNITSGLLEAGAAAGVGFTSVAIAPKNSAVAAVSQTGFGTGNHHVFLTTNSGTGWTDISGPGTDFPDVITTRLMFDRNDPSGNTLLAGTSMGVWRTTNSLSANVTWSNYNLDSLPQVQVYDLRQNSSNIVAGTFGRGVWVLKSRARP